MPRFIRVWGDGPDIAPRRYHVLWGKSAQDLRAERFNRFLVWCFVILVPLCIVGKCLGWPGFNW